MARTYIDFYDYLRMPTGQNTSSMIGNPFRLQAPQTLGASSLTVPQAAIQQPIYAYSNLYIFDGANSEVVMVSGDILGPTTSIALVTPTQYAHSAGATCCTDPVNQDGTPSSAGSLAPVIFTASDEVESICKQPLLQATYTETYALQSMQASIDSIGTLNIRTTKSPVSTVTSAVLNTDVIKGQAIPLTSLLVKFKGQLISVLGAGGGVPQCTEGDIDVTFTAGYLYAQLPPRVKQAAVWLVSDILSDRINSTGAAMESQGKIHIQHRLLHETKSMFYMRAEEALKEYAVKVY
jgi:hypothetical protein